MFMYGRVDFANQQMVPTLHGEIAWQCIKKRAALLDLFHTRLSSLPVLPADKVDSSMNQE